MLWNSAKRLDPPFQGWTLTPADRKKGVRKPTSLLKLPSLSACSVFLLLTTLRKCRPHSPFTCCFWVSTPPNPNDEASADNLVSYVEEYWVNTAVELSSFFSFWNASCWGVFQHHSFFSDNRSFNGHVNEVRCGRHKFSQIVCHAHDPLNISYTAELRHIQYRSHLARIRCNSIWSNTSEGSVPFPWKRHISHSVFVLSLQVCSELDAIFRYVAVSFPLTPQYHLRVQPSSICLIWCWKCSGADKIPNGNRLKVYRPNGVMKVVRSKLSFVRGIYQNPDMTSSYVNTLAPANVASGWPTAGKMCLSQLTHLFRWVRSTL